MTKKDIGVNHKRVSNVMMLSCDEITMSADQSYNASEITMSVYLENNACYNARAGQWAGTSLLPTSSLAILSAMQSALYAR